MNRFDFSRDVDRRGTHSVKWSFFAEDVLPMWIADTEFAAPPEVVEAMRARLEHPVFGYQEDSPSLREAMAARMAERSGWRVDPDWIVLLPGLVIGLNLVAHMAGALDDGVVMTPPIYPPFLHVCHLHHRTAQMAPLRMTREGHLLSYALDGDALRAAITPRTRLMLFCNPHNPSGRVFTRAELEQVAALCLEHDLILCSDEIHSDLVLDGQHIPVASLAPEVQARTITLIAPSKTFNIPGLGCAGAIIPDEALRKRFREAKFGFGALTNIMGYVAAEAAYRHGDAWLSELLAHLRVNRELVADFAAERLPGVAVTRPEATYLTWMDFRDAGLEQPAAFLLEHARVALNDGSMFGEGGAGFARLNFGCSRDMLLGGLERIEAALRSR